MVWIKFGQGRENFSSLEEMWLIGQSLSKTRGKWAATATHGPVRRPGAALADAVFTAVFGHG